jgi:hypothetical protein
MIVKTNSIKKTFVIIVSNRNHFTPAEYHRNKSAPEPYHHRRNGEPRLLPSPGCKEAPQTATKVAKWK